MAERMPLDLDTHKYLKGLQPGKPLLVSETVELSPRSEHNFFKFKITQKSNVRITIEREEVTLTVAIVPENPPATFGNRLALDGLKPGDY